MVVAIVNAFSSTAIIRGVDQNRQQYCIYPNSIYMYMQPIWYAGGNWTLAFTFAVDGQTGCLPMLCPHYQSVLMVDAVRYYYISSFTTKAVH